MATAGPDRAEAGTVRAWIILRAVAAYGKAWRAHAKAGRRDPDPQESGAGFPVRVQTGADLEAAAFDLLAWQDPEAVDGPASPFWVQHDMPEAAVAPGGLPLAGVVADGGGSLEGLRLGDGSLVLKIERGEAAVQILLRDPAPFPEGAGIELRHPFGLRMPHGMRRLIDFWEVAGRPPPPPAGRRTKTASWPS